MARKNSSFQRVTGAENENLVQQGNFAETEFTQTTELEFERGRDVKPENEKNDIFLETEDREEGTFGTECRFPWPDGCPRSSGTMIRTGRP